MLSWMRSTSDTEWRGASSPMESCVKQCRAVERVVFSPSIHHKSNVREADGGCTAHGLRIRLHDCADRKVLIV
ncbi:hypothetical protein BBBOND_0208990 [Babesia bigemina]|uniref:Uncharacterized protein n=1 Tax=Babesia bigemina TaxID=5866 RepID=A0A061DCS9_BABBI|nr:hypothetical protein BBBOND_0208990 [Babesia bigemina]CDR95745.1 hypothetical protein BBBOND_0208990 [Babesia bigemina]|eukprot:XP_012767931.1 hypothetical protein BBBOND_0208990 [Babesia bigemina]